MNSPNGQQIRLCQAKDTARQSERSELLHITARQSVQLLNKKAQIPTVLLFLIALLLVATSLYVMISSNTKITLSSAQLTAMMEEIEFNKDYVLANAKILSKEAILLCQTCSDDSLKEKLKIISQEKESLITTEKTGNFFGKIRNFEFEIAKQGGTITIEINNLFVQSRKEANNIIRPFDLCLEFHSNGDFVGECGE